MPSSSAPSVSIVASWLSQFIHNISIAIVLSNAVLPVFCLRQLKGVTASVSAGVNPWGLKCGQLDRWFFCHTLPTFSHQPGFLVQRRFRLGRCCRFQIYLIIHRDFFMAIVHRWIARVFIDMRFCHATMTSTGVVRSWPVMAIPSCDHSRFSYVEFDIHWSQEYALYSIFERPVAM